MSRSTQHSTRLLEARLDALDLRAQVVSLERCNVLVCDGVAHDVVLGSAVALARLGAVGWGAKVRMAAAPRPPWGGTGVDPAPSPVTTRQPGIPGRHGTPTAPLPGWARSTGGLGFCP